MKIIDTHTHFPGSRLGAQPRPVGQLRTEFESNGLVGAWVMTVDGLIQETSHNNEILASAVRDDLDFFAPFCTVNPHDGAEAAVKEIERAGTDLGMRGLKLHPWLQAFSLSHPAVLPILQTAGQLGMPVLFHDGTPPYSTPLQIASVAEKVPQTRIILGHAGLDDLYKDAILACLRHPNIYLCCCSLSSGCIEEIIRRCPAGRLLFGSDGGFTVRAAGAALNKILAVCDDEGLLKAILYDNPQAILPLAEKEDSKNDKS